MQAIAYHLSTYLAEPFFLSDILTLDNGLGILLAPQTHRCKVLSARGFGYGGIHQWTAD